jgi:membrane protein CcdC involved in cytochrome C biogenesis
VECTLATAVSNRDSGGYVMVKKYEETQRVRKRSVAWVYYAILALCFVFAAFAVTASAFVAALVCGAYSVYLFRGGRFVVWIW